MKRPAHDSPAPRPAAGAPAPRAREIAARATGFTLIELMVSVALVLILILGINQVFKIASDTVNAGQAISSADRDNRGIQGVLYPDFQSAVITGAPCFIIRSGFLPAFRNRADELSDKDAKPLTVDIDSDGEEGKGSVPGEIVYPTAINSRNHRLDELMFFASGRFQRQSGSGSRLSGSGASTEAFIYYGHLQLANNQNPPTYFNPGAGNGGKNPAGSPEASGSPSGKNDNNLYASQWALGRMPILLVGDNVDPNSTYIKNGSESLSPLAKNSKSSKGDLIEHSTCDVAQISMAAFKDKLPLAVNGGNSAEPWYETVAGVRFWANPFPVRPLNADKVSRTAPIFVQGCTQFIVEYAGDFLAQDNNPLLPGTATKNPKYGWITSNIFDGVNDGVTDYVVVNGVRRTRWYGMPRNVDTTDDDRKTGRAQIKGGSPGADPNTLIDVVPLRDVLATSTGGTVPSFEQSLNEPKGLKLKSNYALPGAVPADVVYAAAWAPADLARGSGKRPTMIRITVVVDDPAGRMSEGQSFEYVFDLP